MSHPMTALQLARVAKEANGDCFFENKPVYVRTGDGLHAVLEFNWDAGADGFVIVIDSANARTFTELELLTAVEAGQVWHEFDHDHVILEDEHGQEEIDEQFRTIWHLANCDGGSRYRLNENGKERLAELRAEDVR